MSRYKIDESKLIEIKNSGGGGFGEETKIKLFQIAQKRRNHLKNLKDNVQKIIDNRENIVYLEYFGIPPKTKRFTFGKKYKNLDSIPQRGIHTFSKNSKLCTRLFYELDSQMLEWLLDKLNEVLESDSFESITRNTYIGFLNKLVDRKDKIILLNAISATKPISSFDGVHIIRLIPIRSIIKELKEKNILNPKNFDEKLMFAYLNNADVKRISDMGHNIFITSLKPRKMFIINNSKMDIKKEIKLSSPSNKNALIGIIDSGNNLLAPFDKFIVSNEDHREFGGETHDYEHGSLVASLIIANDELNPSQPDGFGNFKVKHFEILEKNQQGETTASFNHMIKKLREIINNNQDIKVWNLSFGARKKPYSLMMSEIGKLLDILSFEYNILFVVASGNNRQEYNLESLNAPGDSLNSITIGSSKYENGKHKYSEYSSFGSILHFEKPEVSYFGGPNNKDGSPLVGYYDGHKYFIEGTSFSTPRICRMAAHFIKEGFNIAETKAKIISLAEYVTPSLRASSFGVVNFAKPEIDIYFSSVFKSNNPRVLPIKIPKETERITLSNSRIVFPMPRLGEEYSVHNFDVKLVAYDTSNPEPQKNNLTRVVAATHERDNKYSSEKIMRFDSGKYFNTHIKEYRYEKVLEAQNKLITEKKVPKENIGIAIFIKKLDLFDTENDQKQKISVVMNIFGKNIDINKFENNNSGILEAEVDT